MTFLKQHRHYVETIVGLISFGLGQRLLGKGILTPWATDNVISYTLSFLGGLFFIIGSVLLIKQLIWFVKGYNQKNRVVKVLGLAVLTTFLIGLGIGWLGQLLYDHTPISYTDAKYIIWLASTTCQTLVKLVVLYYFSCFYHDTRVSFQDKRLWLVLSLAILLLISASLATRVFPDAGEALLGLVDGLIIVGASYYLIMKHQHTHKV